jgi:hypothetical protein
MRLLRLRLHYRQLPRLRLLNFLPQMLLRLRRHCLQPRLRMLTLLLLRLLLLLRHRLRLQLRLPIRQPLSRVFGLKALLGALMLLVLLPLVRTLRMKLFY